MTVHGARRLALLAAVFVAGCARPAAASPTKAIAIDSLLVGDCAAGPPNRIGSAFTLDHARDLWLVFPRFKAPELEVDAPAVVVVMPDPVLLPTTVGRNRASNAICVKVDGVPNIYTDIDMTGSLVPQPT
jgi:hypothetical protein